MNLLRKAALGFLASTISAAILYSGNAEADRFKGEQTPEAQEWEKRLDAASSEEPTQNNQIIWIDQSDDGSSYLRANITEPRFQATGVGVGNLVSALWANPELNSLSSDEAVNLVVSSNMKGARYSDARFRQLEDCITQQESLREIGNPDLAALKDASSFQTSNVLYFNQTPGNPAQFSCELSDSFVEVLEERDASSKGPVYLEDLGNRVVETDLESGAIELEQSLNSDYQSLQKILREDSGKLARYDLIGSDTVTATYDLVKSVAAGEVELSETERKDLAIDAYNVLSDQKSEYFVSVAEIKENLGVSYNLREEAVALCGIGRKEQIQERKNQLESAVAANYQNHLANSSGLPEEFNDWCRDMRSQGARNETITNVLSDVPEAESLDYKT